MNKPAPIRSSRSGGPAPVRRGAKRRPSSSRPAGARETAPRVREWLVAMAGGCNLRCSYCATDFGRLGRRGGVMSLATAAGLAEQIAAAADPRRREVKVSFGGGETFLHFDRFVKIADLIADRCGRRGVRVRLGVTTNGTLLNEARLQQLAKRRIGLTFSIDGPEGVHDACRRSLRGKGSFRLAFANWARYREIARTLDPPPGCLIHSVFGESAGSLSDLVRFWLEQGVPLQSFAPQSPSRFNPSADRGAAVRLHNRYLEGMREWASAQAQTCTPESFLGEYRGPDMIYSGWKRLLFGRERPMCAPGLDVLAVDSEGSIYPCDAYVGIESRRLGDVFSGIDPQRRAAFAALCRKAKALCAACDHRVACEKPCLAATATATPAQNVRRHCRTMKKAAAVVQDSFARLMQNESKEAADA